MAALTPLSVDGMIVAASTTLLADSRSGAHGGVLPWLLLVIGSVASLAANVAVAEPSVTGRVIAAWPSFALIGSYEMLMRQVRRAADSVVRSAASSPAGQPGRETAVASAAPPSRAPLRSRTAAGHGLRREAWEWAVANLEPDGSLPSADDRGPVRPSRAVGQAGQRAGIAGDFADACA